jgi:hypothetical protein
MSSSTMLSLVAVLAGSGLHLVAGRLHRGAAIRPSWLTAASGMSVAYVFVHLLPELAEVQDRWLEARPERALYWLKSHIYIAALLGVIVALGLDRVAHRRQHMFWLPLMSFAIYNALIGGFALRLHTVPQTLLAVIAFGAHFLINDHALQRRYGGAYVQFGRWLLASSLVLGWIVTRWLHPPVIIMAAILGTISGGIIMNVLKEELPERESRYLPWVIGALGYTALLLALIYSERN